MVLICRTVNCHAADITRCTLRVAHAPPAWDCQRRRAILCNRAMPHTIPSPYLPHLPHLDIFFFFCCLLACLLLCCCAVLCCACFFVLCHLAQHTRVYRAIYATATRTWRKRHRNVPRAAILATPVTCATIAPTRALHASSLAPRRLNARPPRSSSRSNHSNNATPHKPTTLAAPVAATYRTYTPRRKHHFAYRLRCCRMPVADVRAAA